MSVEVAQVLRVRAAEERKSAATLGGELLGSVLLDVGVLGGEEPIEPTDDTGSAADVAVATVASSPPSTPGLSRNGPEPAPLRREAKPYPKPGSKR